MKFLKTKKRKIGKKSEMTIYRPEGFSWDSCYVINEINSMNEDGSEELFTFKVLDQLPFQGQYIQEDTEEPEEDEKEYLLEEYCWC